MAAMSVIGAMWASGLIGSASTGSDWYFRSCRYRRTRRPSPAQDGAGVAAAAGECGCQVKTANRRFRQRHEAAGLRREAIDRALGRVKIVMNRLGGRHFALDDGAGDPGEIAIEIAYDPIHPAFPADPLSVGVAIGPIRQSIDADHRHEIGAIRVQFGIDLIVGDEAVRRYARSGVVPTKRPRLPYVGKRHHPSRQYRRRIAAHAKLARTAAEPKRDRPQ